MRLPFGLEFSVENITFQHAHGMKVEVAWYHEPPSMRRLLEGALLLWYLEKI